MVDKSMVRWWTYGQFEPRPVELIEYFGDDTWSSQDLIDGDIADVTERELYESASAAWSAHAAWLEDVRNFISFHITHDLETVQELARRWEIALDKATKGEGR